MKFLVLSHDGASLVIVYADRVVVHSTDNGKKILNLGLASKWGVPTCVRLGRSGKHLVVGTTKGLAVWKIEADKASSPIFKSSQRVNSVDISWDDTLVASVSSDDTVRMYRLGALKDKRQIGPKNQAKVVAFSPTSDAIVVGLAGGGLQIFNTAKGAKLTTFGGNASAIHSLSFSSDGHWLVEQGEAGLRTWDTSELTKPTLKEGIHDGKVDRVSISPDSNTIALVDAEGRVYVRTNYPTESAVTREVGRVPSLPSDYSVGRRDVSVLGDGSGVAVGSEVSFPSQVRIYKFASYDSPATYRIDCTRA
ncbi:hypothetical protein FRB99_001503 [Tulasnella sp. 403]|nr:hypothetical protein FRB99_001503 [Tulasnella sp. 403]